jgi:hypothetical protein
VTKAWRKSSGRSSPQSGEAVVSSLARHARARQSGVRCCLTCNVPSSVGCSRRRALSSPLWRQRQARMEPMLSRARWRSSSRRTRRSTAFGSSSGACGCRAGRWSSRGDRARDGTALRKSDWSSGRGRPSCLRCRLGGAASIRRVRTEARADRGRREPRAERSSLRRRTRKVERVCGRLRRQATGMRAADRPRGRQNDDRRRRGRPKLHAPARLTRRRPSWRSTVIARPRTHARAALTDTRGRAARPGT